jgi:hypothetical protein
VDLHFRDDPIGEGDYETRLDFPSESVCDDPIGLDARARTSGSTEVTHTHLFHGFWCTNKEQSDGDCADFEVSEKNINGRSKLNCLFKFHTQFLHVFLSGKFLYSDLPISLVRVFISYPSINGVTFTRKCTMIPHKPRKFVFWS